MSRCKVCIYPDTRPDAHFVDGVCSACREFEASKSYDWAARLDALVALLDVDNPRAYHAVVPVSGGKDSHYQVLKLLELGARVLAVAAATDYLTPLGRRNLDNLKRYCSVVEITPHLRVRKALVRLGLNIVGDMSWPEHAAIWSIPTRVAVQMKIPLIVWGENPQRCYANPEGVPPATELNEAWVSQFGGFLGLRLDDLIGQRGLTARDLELFRFPDLSDSNTKGVWLGDYVPWDGWKNALIAQQYGFEVSPVNVEGTGANYENLDNYVTVLRDYMRYLKYGYTRATDILSSHARHGRLTRDEALKLEALSQYEPLKTSLGKPIEEVLAYFDITPEQFKQECASWASQSE